MEPVLRRRYARVFLEIAGEVVSGASEPTLLSSVTVSSGTSIFDGLGYTNATIIGGSSVSLSSYTGGTQKVAAVLEAVDSQEAADSQVAVVALAAVVGIDNKKS